MAEVRSDAPDTREDVSHSLPEISVCESCPGKSVFLESGNTDGWISSDVTVDVTQ
ncbi:hypothetical protein ACFQJC_07205 [Haloferax namakaokahaiae]|uniref:Uncharacterized protein n=1 Tax=Haloferax namakaokahaiae TaxID=1748331 RepID=A0ABD5ZDM5_9EURY